ncbi:MAG TPA: hypothetical protein VGN20_07975 [Mucilaginibacter sp.]|jgi:hypothetical protein
MINELSNPNPTTSSVAGVKIKKPRSGYVRYFFVTMACLFLIIAAFGFVPSYTTMHAGTLLNWYVHVHGAIMTLWLLVFLTQAILAAKGNLKFHCQLGQFSVILGALVWISMGIVIFNAHIGFPPHKNIFWYGVLLISSNMNLFGLFFTWGILVRKNSAAHKRLLFMATMVLISAGLNRIFFHMGLDPSMPWLHWPGIAASLLSAQGNLSAFLIYDDLLIIPLFIYDLLTVRRVHRITIIGSAWLIGVHFMVMILWGLLN